jgi:hypothetical protein
MHPRVKRRRRGELFSLDLFSRSHYAARMNVARIATSVFIGVLVGAIGCSSSGGNSSSSGGTNGAGSSGSPMMCASNDAGVTPANCPAYYSCAQSSCNDCSSECSGYDSCIAGCRNCDVQCVRGCTASQACSMCINTAVQCISNSCGMELNQCQLQNFHGHTCADLAKCCPSLSGVLQSQCNAYASQDAGPNGTYLAEATCDGVYKGFKCP